MQHGIAKHVNHGRDVFAVQGRHDGAPPHFPDIAVGGDHALAHHELQDLTQDALRVVGRIRKEHLQVSMQGLERLICDVSMHGSAVMPTERGSCCTNKWWKRFKDSSITERFFQTLYQTLSPFSI